MVVVKNLTFCRNGKTILDSISCTLLSKTVTLFIGKSGAGKTTLLESIAHVINPNCGTILLNNQELKSKKPTEIGFVFQQFNLFPHLTVLENCTNPLLVHGVEQQAAQKRALEQLEQFGMESYAHQYPASLSGGQQQRVAIARALCLNPSVLLLDEPTASLDPINTENLIMLLKQLAQHGLTIGISSQDMPFVKAIFDRIYYIEDGKIIEFCDDKNLLNCPQTQKFCA